MSGDGTTSPKVSRPADEGLPAESGDVHMAMNGKLEEDDLYSDIDPAAGGSKVAVNAASKEEDARHDDKHRNGHERYIASRLVVKRYDTVPWSTAVCAAP